MEVSILYMHRAMPPVGCCSAITEASLCSVGGSMNVKHTSMLAHKTACLLCLQVEVKLRLPSEQDYQKLEQLLSGCHRATFEQVHLHAEHTKCI